MDSAVALLSSLFLSLPGLYLRTLKANRSILIFLDLSPCIFMTFKLCLVFCPLYLPSWAFELPINMTMLKNICAHYGTTQVIISFGYPSVLFNTYYSFNPIFSKQIEIWLLWSHTSVLQGDAHPSLWPWVQLRTTGRQRQKCLKFWSLPAQLSISKHDVLCIVLSLQITAGLSLRISFSLLEIPRHHHR